MAIRVAIVDDHPIVLQGLQQLFERHQDFEVVCCSSNGAGALADVRTHRPDVLILDLRMPEMSGLDVLRALAEEAVRVHTVLLTAAVADEDVTEAVRLGARGLILKESPPEALLDCVRRVYRGEQWLERETVTRAFQRFLERENSAHGASKVLTTREMESVRMVAQGLRNKVIAERLSITEGTVKVHLHNIYDKFGIDGRLELLLVAKEKGIT